MLLSLIQDYWPYVAAPITVIGLYFGYANYVQKHIKEPNRELFSKLITLSYKECFNVIDPQLINGHDYHQIISLTHLKNMDIKSKIFSHLLLI